MTATILSAVQAQTVHLTLPIQEIKINEKEKLGQATDDCKQMLASLTPDFQYLREDRATEKALPHIKYHI